MLEKLLHFIKEEALFLPKQPILLAVSGGLDSVAMAELFHRAGFQFGIAHCNFQLREAESEGDAQFVAAFAQRLQVPFYQKVFDTLALVEKSQDSTQMLARTLRYDWLENMRQAENYAYIATAHHQNDSLETVLYNFAKGCGIRGLHGILAQQNQLIRPMLFATRRALANWVAKEAIDYREDSSNASDYYRRNFIRHQIIPAFENINPSFIKTGTANLQRLRETEWLFHHAIEQIRAKAVQTRAGLIYIERAALPKEAASSVLYELLLPYGFNNEQVRQILLEGHLSGAEFHAAAHRLVVDRASFVIAPKEALDQVFWIEAKQSFLDTGRERFQLSLQEQAPATFPKGNQMAWLDAEQLRFPLKLRRWQAGDVFQPLGMAGQHQSLQDFFTHRKLSRPEKERVWLLESGGEICWVVGLRLDERFKLRSDTKQVLQIEVLPSDS